MRPVPCFIYIALICIVVYPAGAYPITPLDEIENPGVPVVQPNTVIPFNQSDVPGDIALSTDGKHLVYSESTLVLDIWAAIVHYWPELISALAAAVIVTRLVVSWRRRRRFSREHGPYCAKCAYSTRGLHSDDCPECVDVKGITPGITRARFAFTQLILLGIAGLIGTIYVLDPPRDIQAKRWITWRSESLVGWVSNQQKLDLNDSIRYCTAARTIPIDDPTAVRTICRVMDSAEFGILSIVKLHTYTGPRPHGFERLMSNTPQTYTGITSSDFYAVIDLETLHVRDAGRLRDDADNHFMSDDGKSRIGLGWGESTTLEFESLDGTKDRKLPYFEKPAVELSIRTRGAIDWSSLGFDDDEAGTNEPPQFVEQQVNLIRRGVGSVSLYSPYVWNQTIGTQVAADYVLLMGSRSVLIYDLITNQWLVELDLSAIVGSIWKPDGTSLAVSADRSTLAVINDDGSKIAVYDLPVNK